MMGSAYAQSKLPACSSGWFSSGFHNCFGSHTYANSAKYVGEWSDNQRNGQGTLTFPDGDKFVGEWRDNMLNGQGTFTSASGEKYVGAFKDAKYNGQGTFTNADGNKYVGSFKDDKFNGQGTFTFADGSKYVGEWKDGIWNGKGTLTDDKDNKYIGEWKDGKKNGQGTYFYLANNQFKGNKYVGEWKENMRNGQGTEYAPDDSILRQGIWANNKFVRSAPAQQVSVPNQEIERLRAEAAEAKRKQAEAEGKMRDAQQLASQNRENERLRAEVSEAKRKQAEAEEKTLVAQQQTTLTPPVTILAAIPTGKRVALVVGNKNYKVRPLQNTLNDADDISRSLRTSGFEVIDLRDATLPQMRTAVRQFGDKLLTYDVGLVYYSGHGVEVKGRNYFIPVNADIQREDEIADQGLDVSLILEKMSTAGKGVNILIVDACRDDPFGRSFRSTSRGLAQMDAPRGTIIAYSTSPGKVASDGDTRERNSPYTKHLLRAMQSPNKPIEQVFKEVRRAVQDETKNQQTPWENTSLSGDFFFKVQR